MALVTTTEMFKKAFEGKYSIGAFNINNMEIVQGVLRGAAALNSAVILQCSKSALKYAGPRCMHDMVAAIAEETGVDVALHLDHGPDLETVKLCVENGFTSVMFDGSHYDYEENVAKTKEVVDYAHAHGVVVEAELGKLAGVEDEVSVAEGHATYTDPDQALDFVQRTGVDSLAVAIGISSKVMLSLILTVLQLLLKSLKMQVSRTIQSFFMVHQVLTLMLLLFAISMVEILRVQRVFLTIC